MTDLYPKCKACGASIFFMKTRAGKMIPVNVETIGDGKIFDPKKMTAHFATCPYAEQFRKAKKEGKA